MSTPVSLTDLKDISGNALTTNPTIDTSISFNAETTGPDPVPITCTNILRVAKTSPGIETFKRLYKIDSLQSNVARLATQLESADPSKTITEATNLRSITEYLNVVKTTQIPVLNQVYNCISEANLADPTAVATAAANYDTSLSRYQELTMDPLRVSYYEGWFPIHRPLKLISMFLLFGLGMFFIIVSILFFLQMKGIQLKLEIPATGIGPSFGSIPPHLTQIGIAGALVGLIIVALGLWQKWF